MSADDVVVWPDGTTCARDELGEYGWMSDDYRIISEQQHRRELRQERSRRRLRGLRSAFSRARRGPGVLTVLAVAALVMWAAVLL